MVWSYNHHTLLQVYADRTSRTAETPVYALASCEVADGVGSFEDTEVGGLVEGTEDFEVSGAVWPSVDSEEVENGIHTFREHPSSVGWTVVVLGVD